VTGDQKVIAVSKNENGPFVVPSARTVKDGSYPIARPLYVYTAGQPAGQIKDYIEWVLDGGQTLVAKLGFVPL
jgi:phosphate transport system substrate-binding protein